MTHALVVVPTSPSVIKPPFFCVKQIRSNIRNIDIMMFYIRINIPLQIHTDA